MHEAISQAGTAVGIKTRSGMHSSGKENFIQGSI